MSDQMVTHCKDCVFAKTSDEGQNGCALGRDELLGVKTVQDNYFVLDRFCATYRPEEWVEELSFEEQCKINEVVLEEVYPRMGYFVRFNTSESDAIAQLKKTIESISKASHVTNGMPTFVVVINDKVEYNEEIWTMFLAYFGDKSETDYHIVQINEKPEKDVFLMDEAFIHAKNAWIHTVTSGQEVPVDINDRLHRITNIELKPMVVVEPYNEFDGFIFPAYLFKFLNGNKAKVYQDELVDKGTFLEKIHTAEERSDVKTVYSWEEFNAA